LGAFGQATLVGVYTPNDTHTPASTHKQSGQHTHSELANYVIVAPTQTHLSENEKKAGNSNTLEK